MTAAPHVTGQRRRPAPEPSAAAASGRHRHDRVGSRGFRQVPGLDGLRGVALLVMMCYHAGVHWLPGGLLSIDVFFVLSGFLITSLLLAEYSASGRISLRRFWSRRARRLVPALLMLLIAMVFWAQFVSPASSRASLRADALSTLGYVANWRFIFSHQGYFDHFGPQSPLLHTWSVAVEEQFYLLWPLLMLLVVRWRRRGVFALAFFGASASAVLMIVLSLNGASHDRLYYGTDTRALPLLLGCSLAALRPPQGFGDPRRDSKARQRALQAVIQLIGLAGAVTLVLCWTLVSDSSEWLYRGGFVLAAFCAAAVVLSCADAGRGPLALLLSFPPLRYIGQISYGSYLAHWPIFQLLTHARTGASGAGLLGLRFAVTFAVAALSYHFIEQPIRRGALSKAKLTRWLPRRAAGAVLPVGGIAIVGGLVAALFIATSVTPAQLARAGALPVDSPGKQPLKPRPPALSAAQRYVLNRPIRVLVEGDSLASTLAPGLADEDARYNYTIFNLGTNGCGIARGDPFRDDRGIGTQNPPCLVWPANRAKDVKTYDPDVALLVTGRWEILDRVHDGQWMHVGEPAYDSYLGSELDRAIGILSAGGAKVLLASAPCFAPQEQPDGTIYPFDDPARIIRYNQLLEQAVARHPQVAAFADVHARLCPTGSFTSTINGAVVRTSDGIHISRAGGEFLSQTLGPQLVALGSVRRAEQAETADQNESTAPVTGGT